MVPVYSSSLASEMAFLWWRKRSRRKFCEIKRGAAFYLVTNKPKNLKRLFFKNCHLLVLERKCNAFYQARSSKCRAVTVWKEHCLNGTQRTAWSIKRCHKSSIMSFLERAISVTYSFETFQTRISFLKLANSYPCFLETQKSSSWYTHIKFPGMS